MRSLHKPRMWLAALLPLLSCPVTSGWAGLVGRSGHGRGVKAQLCSLRAVSSVYGQQLRGLDDSSSDALRKFLGEDESVRCMRTFEDGLAENRADYTRECNAKPWASFKRFVARKDRDTRFPTSWTVPEGGLTSDPESMVAIASSALLSKEECASIIAEAEAVAQWTKSFPHASKEREASMPDRVKVDELPSTLAWLGPTLARRLCPAIEAAFPACPEAKAQNLRLYQATVLRYDASASHAGPVSTPVHQDFSFLTMTVPLNDPEMYSGGGTWIHPLQRAVRPPTGHALAHAGRVWHAGEAVTGGTRYALALFFHSAACIEHGRRFEQRATSLIANGAYEDAYTELTLSLRAYKEAAAATAATNAARPQQLASAATAATSAHPHQHLPATAPVLRAQQVVAEGQALWGILANLHYQLGKHRRSCMQDVLEEAEASFIKHVEHLRLVRQVEGVEHPSFAGVMHNLELLVQRKKTAD